MRHQPRRKICRKSGISTSGRAAANEGTVVVDPVNWLLCNGELRHHSRVFMFENVAMCHVGRVRASGVRKTNQNLAEAAVRYRRDVLPAGAVRFRRLAVL